ncbi:SDR family NAD(P)-dependent oxidoreductase [Meridianimarinicoccus aquatilis]|uniref:SDR family oxidoreductase n=1 Tax=Meridianimarinicoccus aquatilis TaxID=2552766 RepID=A0A4R6AJJ2_9RHOB|nr:SDR family oxidoreductase [Fluviibacterium aquatile]TDL84401.1 SDR family oxidoreductase [Fluviibacterium aquatile]
MTDAKLTALPVLVTGASRGLGAAYALELARHGHHVMAVARTTGGLEELDDRIKQIGGSATLAPLDITDDGAMQHMCRSIHDRWGGVAIWVHAAIHAAPLTPVPFIDAKDWTKSINVNTNATQRLIAYIAPLLGKSADAKAVFFDDPQSSGKFLGTYGASKAAQMVLARSWQAETAKTGPTVVIQTPAPLATATRARFYPGEDRDVLASPADEAARLCSALLA